MKESNSSAMPDSAKVRAILNSVGWFIPPFVGIHTSEALSLEIARSNGAFTQHQLERALGRIYGPDRLAAMILYKYSEVLVVREYREIIGESVAAHFLGLGHVAVSGLMPAVEGIGLGLIQQWSLTHPRGVKNMFGVLLDDAKNHATSGKYGVTQEILDVIDGLRHFLNAYFLRTLRFIRCWTTRIVMALRTGSIEIQTSECRSTSIRRSV
jgi:hypothetical protein